MSRLLLRIIILLGLAAAISAQTAPVSTLDRFKRQMRAKMSPDRAKHIVHEFMEDPGIKFSELTLDYFAYPLVSYELDAVRPGRTWYVNIDTGLVEYYSNYRSDRKSSKPYGPLTREQCLKIASDFASAKCPGFAGRTFERKVAWNGTGWTFDWTEKVEYGALTDNFVSVSVSPSDGQVVGYRGELGPTPHPQQLKIDSEQAKQIARTEWKLPKTESVDVLGLKAKQDGTLEWAIAKMGKLPDGQEYAGILLIDAVTGKVTPTEGIMGPPPEPHATIKASKQAKSAEDRKPKTPTKADS